MALHGTTQEMHGWLMPNSQLRCAYAADPPRELVPAKAMHEIREHEIREGTW